jgi:hypothetical protein
LDFALDTAKNNTAVPDQGTQQCAQIMSSALNI